MITVDVKNPIELRAAGIRALNEGLGVDVARMFIEQYFGGRGDYTTEKYDRPDMTDEEYAAMKDSLKAEAVAAGTWGGGV